MSTAFISALGMMGRRHLKGLVRAGFNVSASDPNPAAFETARKELAEAGLPAARLTATDNPQGRFDIAIFAETTPARLANFQRFLAGATAGRILLEKPLSADPEEFVGFLAAARQHGVEGKTQVNLIRRAWPHVQHMQALCADESRFSMTVNGGAIGLGCMGIHYLDTFLILSGESDPKVVWASLSEERVASGRGTQFEDFGAEFVVQAKRGVLLGSLEAASSANVQISIRGAHFLAQLDYGDMQWKLARRKPESVLPNYRYGADYELVEQWKVEIPPMDVVTEAWAQGRQELPGLEQALITHRLLDDILKAGGAKPPYAFT